MTQESRSQQNLTIEEPNSKPTKITARSLFDLTQFRDVDAGIRLTNSWAIITEPSVDEVFVRGKDYMETSQKINVKSILFPLVAAECLRTPVRIDHLAQSKYHTWFHDHIDPDDKNIFVLIIQLQVQSVNATFVHYHVWEGGLPIKTDSTQFNQLFSEILDGGDDFRNARLKLIPRIVNGPFAVQAMVKNSPVLLGTKVKHRYFRGKNYFEIDSEVDESYISAGVLKLCHRFSRSIVVDMCWVIEGQKEEELPERVMCGITIHNLDFSKITDIPSLNQNKLSWKQKKEDHESKQNSSDISTAQNLRSNSPHDVEENSNSPHDVEENSTTAETYELMKSHTLTDSRSQSTHPFQRMYSANQTEETEEKAEREGD
ncbi:hypothetical protein RFI_08248 [Reticulomyxa filosa]|uniref:Protein ENHANCED DISEASE RESISTANCE 2 C-terminal domain-containing protein n=1 Tax=Reticulomyxa filosa TaxID=46433 RepID=X6NRI0_RETFI|nr:hypothetical protein RFI_08248 [Reticulomyxa filosa]|eukprot:ETO28875.1 hypothetical protein RFI_08248 [Reticulomyxa filosa]